MPNSISPNRSYLGRLGEDVTARFLKKKGYQIRERNFRCRQGEVDIIATIDEFLVFVEVKSRSKADRQVNPLISMTKNKCNRIRLLAKTYLFQNDLKMVQPRFDVVTVVFDTERQYELEHIENAF